AEGAHAGKHHAVGRQRLVHVGDQAGVGPHLLQCLLGRAQVADAVVQHGDARRRQSVPLVDGTPVPSTRTASRRQRATPLNDASRMWWVLRPRTSETCSVIWAAWAKDCQKWSAIWGSKGGEPSDAGPSAGTGTS